MPRLGGQSLGVARAHVRGPVQAAQVRQVGVEELLVLGQGNLFLGGDGGAVGRRAAVGCLQPVGEAERLLAGVLRGLEEGAQARVGDDGVDGHG